MAQYLIRITEASGDVVEEVPLKDTVQADAERAQTMHWNAKYGHTADRYKSELLEDGELIPTIGGWDEEDD